MLNIQTPEKPVIGDSIDVHSIFLTIQGEGPHVGRPAVFLRLAGCNLQCPGCDTEYTQGRGKWGGALLVQRIHGEANGNRLVVITGGEPFRQYATNSLILDLHEAGFDVQVETNGTLPAPRGCVADIVCSPKTGKVHHTVENQAMAYKYVLRAGDAAADDGLPLHALGHPASPRLARPPVRLPKSHIYVQPEDSGEFWHNSRNMDAAKESCLKFGYTLGVQLHKIIGVA